ncbi:MAG: outer membrane lipoprotein carrier protein LolA [Gemmatimonadaceae bacterium]|nr:outer membrane lipoprotein carrier protein LolA [Gemmatimonadaceae bacterium]
MRALLLIAALQSPADRAIDAAVQAYAGIRTARATFEQTITNPLLGSTYHSKGEFEQARPNRFAFRFTEPRGDVIVCDGKYVWIYLPASTPGRVSRAPCGSDQAGSLDLIGEFFTDPKSRYTIADGGAATVGGRRAQAVLLTPRTRDADFVRARVWIDPDNGNLLQFEAQEPSGLTRLVRITSFSPNAAVSPSAFAFTPPRGVKVVEVR